MRYRYHWLFKLLALAVLFAKVCRKLGGKFFIQLIFGHGWSVVMPVCPYGIAGKLAALWSWIVLFHKFSVLFKQLNRITALEQDHFLGTDKVGPGAVCRMVFGNGTQTAFAPFQVSQVVRHFQKAAEQTIILII